MSKRPFSMLLQVLRRTGGTLSNDDGDINENGKKAMHVHHAFLYISLPSLHDYDVKLS